MDSDLSGPEGDDAADGIVGRHADRDAITWNHFDPETAQAAAQLCEHFVPGVTLHAIEATRVDSYDGALHVDQIVFTQYSSFAAEPSNQCATPLTVKQIYHFSTVIL